MTVPRQQHHKHCLEYYYYCSNIIITTTTEVGQKQKKTNKHTSSLRCTISRSASTRRSWRFLWSTSISEHFFSDLVSYTSPCHIATINGINNNDNFNITIMTSSISLSSVQSDTANRVPTIFWYWNSRTFEGFSRTLKLHFQGAILDGSLQHEQYYSNI